MSAVASLLEVLHNISREAAAHSSSVRTTRLIIRLLLRFELPGWYFGTTRLIIRLVVQLIIRLVVNYQLQADNPADNQAVSFVVCCRVSMGAVVSASPVLRGFTPCLQTWGAAMKRMDSGSVASKGDRRPALNSLE